MRKLELPPLTDTDILDVLRRIDTSGLFHVSSQTCFWLGVESAQSESLQRLFQLADQVDIDRISKLASMADGDLAVALLVGDADTPEMYYLVIVLQSAGLEGGLRPVFAKRVPEGLQIDTRKNSAALPKVPELALIDRVRSWLGI